MPEILRAVNSISQKDYLFVSNVLHFVFCVFIVFYLYFHMSNQNDSHSKVVFRYSLIAVLISLLADMLSYLVDTRVFFASVFLSHFSMFFSVLSVPVVGAMWNMFFDVAFHIRRKNRKRLYVYLIPAYIMAVCLVINLFSGWFYTIDEMNVYHRGDAYLLDFSLQYVSFLILIFRAATFKANLSSIKTLKHRKFKNSVIWMGAATFFFGVLQALTGGNLALHCFGITGGVLIMFLRFQDDQIVHDVLTGLNNRYALDTYVVEKMKIYGEGQRGNRDLYLLMMDINDFKRINDKYGHIEGDVALKRVSDTLKKIGTDYPQGLFLARYGGDEFTAVFESQSENMVRMLCRQIKETVKVETEDLHYRLTVGVGYAKYTGKSMTMSKLYELADNAMYVDKNGTQK